MNKLIAGLMLMVLPLAVWAVPGTINYQGTLLDSNGIPITNIAPGMNFEVSIWTAASGGSQLYKENHNGVQVDDGVYAFQIGGGTGGTPAWNPTSLFNTSSPRFIQLMVNAVILTPRHQLLSAPFTIQSGNSDALGGQGINYFGTAATDAALQNQLNELNNQLQALCEASGNIWDAGKAECDQAVKVIDFQGKIIPVDQDAVQLSLPTDLDPGKGCDKKHYSPVLVGLDPPTPMTVQSCDKNPVEPPNGNLCGYGLVSAVVKIKLDECPLIKDAGK